jgi:putative aminopeptidase FrvX
LDEDFYTLAKPNSILTTLFFTLFFCQNVFCQNIGYAKSIIDTLTSPYFSGRGAVNNGEQKAADFILKEYKKFGLSKIGTSFFQPFSYPINTFPDVVEVKIDSKKLVAGIDYLVEPSSCKMQGDFQLIWYNESNVPTLKQLKKLSNQRFFENKFIVIDNISTESKADEFELLKINAVGASGIILLEENKLTHHLSTKVTDYVTLRVIRTSLNSFAKNISIKIDQQFLPNYTSQNVIGQLTGTKYPDSIIVFSAHYDHLGKMGNDVYFPGANDNASGVAMLLNLAEHYSKNAPEKTIVFMAFGAEESGIIGSKYFTENPTFPLKNINFLINLDLLGTGDEGIQIVNGSVFQQQFDQLVAINQKHQLLPQIKIRGKAANSDHYWFSEKGVPAFFIYTLGGIKAYHDIDDISTTLPLTEFEDCFRLLTLFVSEL